MTKVQQPTYSIPADHPGVTGPKTGILLLNLGTPDATSYWPMRRYLDEFLSDKRVIEWPSWIWQPVLKLIVLTTRPAKSGKAYASIWDKDTNESPLRRITREQTEGLARRLGDGGGNLVIDWAMRYGNPSIESRLQAMQAQGVTRILLAALYPQYGAPTTATAYDKAFDALKKMRWQPAIRTMPPYHDEPVYIEALARSMKAHFDTLDWEPETVIASFHGLPKSYFLKGDPYHCHCHKTARLLREKLGWDETRMKTTFQSRFGPEEWLQPYTDDTIEEEAKRGVKNLAIISPGFSADCVETLEELGIEGEEEFKEEGGENYTLVPCLNASEPGLDVIETLVRRELSGWVTFDEAQARMAAE